MNLNKTSKTSILVLNREEQFEKRIANIFFEDSIRFEYESDFTTALEKAKQQHYQAVILNPEVALISQKDIVDIFENYLKGVTPIFLIIRNLADLEPALHQAYPKEIFCLNDTTVLWRFREAVLTEIKARFSAKLDSKIKELYPKTQRCKNEEGAKN